MKKLKLNLFMVAAVAIAVVTMSFKMVNTSSLAGEKWFEYTGDGSISNPANYALANGNGEMPPPCPNGDDERCAVLAQPQTGDTAHPNLTTIIDEKEREQQ